MSFVVPLRFVTRRRIANTKINVYVYGKTFSLDRENSSMEMMKTFLTFFSLISAPFVMSLERKRNKYLAEE